MASIYEIKTAIKIIEKHHKKIIILHCVSDYPTKLKDTNLINQELKKFFQIYIGYQITLIISLFNCLIPLVLWLSRNILT